MGQQLIILGVTGTHHIALAEELTALCASKGLEIRHASVRYQNETRFHIGGTPDLNADLEAASLKVLEAPPAEGTPASLDSIQDMLRSIDKKLTSFVSYEKKDDRNKAPKPREKKEGAAPDAGTAGEKEGAAPDAGTAES